MNRWFRFYDDALNDPKVQRLSPDLFKAWVNLLCLASQSDGEIKSLADAAFALRLPETRAAAVITALATKGLLDKKEGGYFGPHNWDRRQYKSDSSKERVQRFRERERNGDCNVTPAVTVTPSDTEQIQIQKTEQVLEFRKVGEGKPKGPRHGATSQKHGTTFIRAGTDDWDAYADDHRKAFGWVPEPNSDGGYWFKTAGAIAPPPPKRLSG